MLRRLSLALVLLALAAGRAEGQCSGGFCPQPAPLWRAAPRAEAPHPAVCRVTNDLGRMRELGSGTLVAVGDQAIVITCAHLFADGVGTISVTFPGRSPLRAELLGQQKSPRADLAALRIAAPNVPPVALATVPPRAGTAATSGGFGPDGRYVPNRGRVNGYLGDEILEISGPSRQGDSGGPIFDARGSLAGVLFGTDGRTTVGTHVGVVRAFLSRLDRGGSQSPAADADVQPPQEATDPTDPAWAERVRTLETQQDRLSKLVEAQRVAFEGRCQQIEAQEVHGCECDPSDLATRTDLRAVAARVDRLSTEIKQANARSADGANAVDATPPPAWAEQIRQAVTGGVEQYIAKRLTVLLLGFGVPGWIAAAAALLVMRRMHKRSRSVRDRVEDDLRQVNPPSRSKPVVVHSESPPPPQVVERERQFVEVQVPSDRLIALQWAMDEYVKRNPGARPTVETIEAFAAQYQSGMKPAKE